MIRRSHDLISWFLIFGNGAVGVWALVAHKWTRYRRRFGWVAVVLAQLIVIVQHNSGVLIQIGEEIESEQHQLYGFATFASVGIIYAYRSEMKDRLYLLYGLGSLWLMGLGIRAALL